VNVPRVLAVSARRALGDSTWSAWCAELARAGVDALQVREKDLDDRALLDLTRRARLAFSRPRLLIVNGRMDVARAAAADGVHLPASGLPTRAVRRTVGKSLLVGRSTHVVDEVRRAADEGADYVLFGPVHSTPSKAGRLEPRGVSLLAEAVRIGVAVLAVGGIDEPGRALEAIGVGAHGVAGIRAFLDPTRAAALVAAVQGATNNP